MYSKDADQKYSQNHIQTGYLLYKFPVDKMHKQNIYAYKPVYISVRISVYCLNQYRRISLALVYTMEQIYVTSYISLLFKPMMGDTSGAWIKLVLINSS